MKHSQLADEISKIEFEIINEKTRQPIDQLEIIKLEGYLKGLEYAKTEYNAWIERLTKDSRNEAIDDCIEAIQTLERLEGYDKKTIEACICNIG